MESSYRMHVQQVLTGLQASMHGDGLMIPRRHAIVNAVVL